jgi:cytidyltransferase-like protein
MIVQFDQLETLCGRVAMVDGAFDPLHRGHIEYFRAAWDLATRQQVEVLCNVASDRYVRSKHEPLLPDEERVAIVDAIRYISYTHLNDHDTEKILWKLRPKYYVKGNDWIGRLPPDQVRICEELRIEIVYLDTVLSSSTRILEEFLNKSVKHDRRGA